MNSKMNCMHDRKRAFTQDCINMEVKDNWSEMSENRTRFLRRVHYRKCSITQSKTFVIFLIIHQILSHILTSNVSGNIFEFQINFFS